METISKEIVALLSYLLPGFMAAWVYFGLTSFPKPSQFERVIQALIFTVFVQFFVGIVKYLLIELDIFTSSQWTQTIELRFSVVFALAIGLFVARFANNDWVHAILRKLKFTKETSHPSEWFGVFSQNPTYIVLHLKDGRRLYGWPREWPSQPANGHFSISEAEWLVEHEEPIKLEGVRCILIPATEVDLVELMDFDSNNENK